MENLFEEKMAKLDEIVNKLSKESLPLSESISLYEEGKKIALELSKELNEASLKVATIMKDNEEVSLKIEGMED